MPPQPELANSYSASEVEWSGVGHDRNEDERGDCEAFAVHTSIRQEMQTHSQKYIQFCSVQANRKAAHAYCELMLVTQ
jgi:hypothetical protein